MQTFYYILKAYTLLSPLMKTSYILKAHTLLSPLLFSSLADYDQHNQLYGALAQWSTVHAYLSASNHAYLSSSIMSYGTCYWFRLGPNVAEKSCSTLRMHNIHTMFTSFRVCFSLLHNSIIL
jgi:hypothetical protein